MLRSKARGALRRASEAAFVAQAGADGRALRTVHAVRHLEKLRELERRYALSIRTVLYVGANEGQELELLVRAFPESVVHCFEPHPGCLQALTRVAARWPSRVDVHPVALSDAVGTSTLRMPSTHPQASSLLAPNAEMSKHFPHVQDWSEVSVPTTTLDVWARDRTLAGDVLLKMDVQGAEPLVLRGGGETVGRIRLVITELSVIPTYGGGSDMHAMFRAMYDLGLAYAGEIEQVRDRDQVVVEFDGAFVRP